MATDTDARLHNVEMSCCRCRYCGRRVSPDSKEWRDHEPFCSERCKLADLDCWFEGEYRIPGSPLETDGETDGGLTQNKGPAGPR